MEYTDEERQLAFLALFRQLPKDEQRKVKGRLRGLAAVAKWGRPGDAGPTVKVPAAIAELVEGWE